MLKIFEKIGHDYYLDVILEPKDLEQIDHTETVEAEIKLGINTLYIGIRGFNEDVDEKGKRKK